MRGKWVGDNIAIVAVTAAADNGNAIINSHVVVDPVTGGLVGLIRDLDPKEESSNLYRRPKLCCI